MLCRMLTWKIPRSSAGESFPANLMSPRLGDARNEAQDPGAEERDAEEQRQGLGERPVFHVASVVSGIRYAFGTPTNWFGARSSFAGPARKCEPTADESVCV